MALELDPACRPAVEFGRSVVFRIRPEENEMFQATGVPVYRRRDGRIVGVRFIEVPRLIRRKTAESVP